MAIFILIFWEDFDLGRNHVHCTHLTARHGIIAHRLWEENLVFGGDDPLGLLPKLFGKDFSRQNGPGKSLPKSSGKQNRRVWVMIPKGSLTKTSVIFPKFSFQRRWATIPCLAVLFT